MAKKTNPKSINSSNPVDDILSSVKLGIYITIDGKIVYINPACEKFTGYLAEEVIGKKNLDYVHPDDRDMVMKTTKRSLKSKDSDSFEYRFIRKNKEIMWILDTISSITYQGKSAALGSFMEITGRRKMDEEIRLNEERYRTILEITQEGYFENDLAGNLIYFNDSVPRIWGYAREELMGMNYKKYTDKETAKTVLEVYSKLYKTGEPIKAFEEEIIRKDGTKAYAEVSTTLIRNSHGEPVGFRGMTRDITKRKLAEDTLRRSEEKYRTILESIQEGYFELDLTGTYTFVNEANCRFLGYTKEELVGMSARKHMDKETTKKISQFYLELYQTGKPIELLEVESLRKDGAKVIYETSVSLIRDSQGKPIGYRGVSRDVTERKQMEEAIHQSEERYRTIIEEMEEWYFETDLAGNLLFFNDAIARLLGLGTKEIAGLNFKVLIRKEDHESIYKLFHQIYETGIPVKNAPYKFVHPDGSTTFAEYSIFPKRDQDGNIIGFRAIGHDITEKRKIQFQLLQSEKMASIGQLAAGVAHEINNPISFISSNFKTLSEYLSEIVRILNLTRSLPDLSEKENLMESDTLNKRMEEIKNLEKEMKIDFIIEDLDSLIKESQEGAERIIRIVRDLKTYTYPGDENLKMADINENIEATLNIVWNELKSKAVIRREYGDIPKIYCHPQELNQVFMNLLVNSSQAIKEKGEIRISTRLDQEDNIEIRIQDNGTGISEENIPKLFNPFFTTKEVGKGTGLGLHVAYSIIQKHEGRIEVESQLGVGTTFIIRIPAKSVKRNS